MADKLELEINVTGMEAAIEKIMELGRLAQKQMDDLTARARTASTAGLPGATAAATTNRASRTRAPMTADEAREAAWRQLNPAQNEKAYWIKKWRNDDRLFDLETRRIKKAEALELKQYQERKAAFANAGRSVAGAAGRGVAWAGAGIAGLTAVGLHSSISGKQLENELALISRELANIFAPFTRRLTRTARAGREWLNNLSGEDQDSLSRLGIGAAAAFILRKPLMAVGGLGLRGAASAAGWAGRSALPWAAGASGFSGLGMLGRLGAAAPIGLGIDFATTTIGAKRREAESADIAKRSDISMSEVTPEIARIINEGKAFGRDDVGRSKFFQKESAYAAAQERKKSDELNEKGWFPFFRPLRIAFMENEKSHDAQGWGKRADTLSKLARGATSGGAPNRERFADNVGYGGVGSTADALQEEMVRSGVGIKNQGPSEGEYLKKAADALLEVARLLTPGSAAANGNVPPTQPGG